MSWLVMVIGLGAAFLLQSCLPGYALLGGARFPLLLSVVLYYSLRRGPEAMAVSACLAGFMLDSGSLMPIGFSCVCFIAIGWYVGRFREFVISDAAVTQAFFGALSAALLTLVQALYLHSVGQVAVSVPQVLLKILGSALLGTLTAPFVFLCLKALERAVGAVHQSRDIEETLGGEFGQSS